MPYDGGYRYGRAPGGRSGGYRRAPYDRNDRYGRTPYDRGDGYRRTPFGRGSSHYRNAPRRGWHSYRSRPRYPAYYRHGYIHLHGFYYPRYYYDYDSYPTHASIRLLVDPSDAEVYVDGYYAGVVDQFDGIFQRLHLAPGPHEITLRLDGFRTWSVEVYADPGRTLKLHHDMIPGPSEPAYGDSDSYGGDDGDPGYGGESGEYADPEYADPGEYE